MNKKNILLGILPAFLTVMSCNNSANKDAETNQDSITATTVDSIPVIHFIHWRERSR